MVHQQGKNIMAWQINYVDQFGTEHPEAYATVTNFQVNKLNKNITVQFSVYHSKNTRDSNKPPIHNISMNIEATPTELIKPIINPNTQEVVTPGEYLPTYDNVVVLVINGTLYDEIAKEIYILSANLPNFKDAVAV